MNEIQKQLTHTIATLEKLNKKQSRALEEQANKYQEHLTQLEKRLSGMETQLSSLIGFIESNVSKVNQALDLDSK